jgi:arylsulfatase A-like enzyme
MLPALLLLSCRGDQPDDTSTPLTLASACGEVTPTGADRALQFDGAPPDNLIIISIDTLRRDRVGFYGGGDATPFLDERLAASVSLSDLRACANWTLPGVFCVVTGQAMFEQGLEPFDPERLEDPTYINPELQTMAGWMRDAGWATTLVTTSKLFSDELPTGNGFQEVVYDSTMDARAVADAAREALTGLQDRAGEAPWYLQVHFRDPHGPYNPPASYQGELAGVDLSPYDPRTSSGISAIYNDMTTMGAEQRQEVRENLETLYAGELRYLDVQLAELWRDWQTAGVLDDALVVFWSDHGEQFFEHGGFQHGSMLHQEESLAIGAFWANNLPSSVLSEPVLHTDIPATILDLYGITPGTTISGVPLGGSGSDRVRVGVGRDKDLRPQLAVDRSGHRLLYHWDGERSYYQTPLDALEEQDLYDATSADVACLWELLLPVIETIDPAEIGEPVRVGP